MGVAYILVGQLWVQCQVVRVGEVSRPLAAPNSKVGPVTVNSGVVGLTKSGSKRVSKCLNTSE